MESDPKPEIVALLNQLKNDLRVARTHSLFQTQNLLRMAILDLLMTLHSISDEELKSYTETLENADSTHKQSQHA